MAIVAASSTSCSSLKCRLASAKTSSETSAGVWVMPSANSNAARSAGENSSLANHAETAAIFSSELPAALPPAALVSIQNGQVTICATRTQTSDRSSAGNVPDRPGAAPSARPASRIGGHRA